MVAALPHVASGRVMFIWFVEYAFLFVHVLIPSAGDVLLGLFFNWRDN